jgi:hypothetical protein
MIVVLEEGEKVHVIARRFFEDDLRRHFVGEVQAVTESAVRLEGTTLSSIPASASK